MILIQLSIQFTDQQLNRKLISEGGRRGRQGVDGSHLGVDERRLGVDGCRRDPDDALRVHETTRTTARATHEDH
jgi:hypothetical protein